MHTLVHTVHAQVHHHLKLQHHRHTGRLLHHQHTSYRALAAVLVLAGMTMAGVSLAGRAAADAVVKPLMTIQGTVPLPVPKTPATIATPADGAALKTNSVLVTGSCPLATPQVVVVILVDSNSVGSAACDADNDFSLPVVLAAGPHTLTAQVYTITSQPGPISSPVHITSPAGVSPATGAGPITLAGDAPVSYLGADKTAVWTGVINGGTAPYHVYIDWNDGTHSTLDVGAGKQSFSHTYDKLMPYEPLLITTDGAGHTLSRQFAVSPYATAAPQTTTPPAVPGAAGGGQSVIPSTTLYGLYGLFVTVISVSGIIWLEAKHTARHSPAAA